MYETDQNGCQIDTAFFFDELDTDKDAYCACNYEDFTYATSPDYHAHRIITRQAATTVI